MPARFEITLFDPLHAADAEHAETLLRIGRGVSRAAALRFNFAELGTGRVFLNARSWVAPDGAFGPPAAPFPQAAYRRLILLHECGHGAGLEHPRGAACEYMQQLSGTRASWARRGLARCTADALLASAAVDTVL